MVQISCGCTSQHPGSMCGQGKKLFATANQALQALVNEKAAIAGNERWVLYTLAHLAYSDHLRGWCEGDVKVQRGMQGWIIFTRFCGRWISHFGTQDENLVYDWLQVQGYQQFVGMGEGAKDHLSGYYRKNAARTVVGRNLSSFLSSEQADDIGVSSERPKKFAEQAIASDVSSPSVDLKTQVIILITLLIARIPNTPTAVEQLLVQRRAANLLRAHGIQIGLQDERAIQKLIKEVVQRKERMNGVPLRNTQALQE